MKKIINIILILFGLLTYSQNQKYFEVVYDIYYNTDVPQIKKGKLQIDIANNHSIFHIGKAKDVHDGSLVTTSEDGFNYNIQYADIDRFIEMDFKSSKIYSKEIHKGKVYFVKDSILNLNWNLNYDDEKKIGSLNCKKATAYFRGRNYTAWYTLEIPLPYGPYKFHGLPGLIVSISDSSNTFTWTIASYKPLANKPNFQYIKKPESIISAKKYFSEIRYPSFSEQESIIQSKLPKGIKLISATSDAHIRKGIEIKFEWEEKMKEQ